jgi:uncharacterized protein YceK
MKRLVLFSLLTLGLSGCSSIPKFPAIDAENFYYVRKDSLGGTEIKAAKIVNNDAEVLILDATWSTTYPQFSISAGVSKLVQPKEKK